MNYPVGKQIWKIPGIKHRRSFLKNPITPGRTNNAAVPNSNVKDVYHFSICFKGN